MEETLNTQYGAGEFKWYKVNDWTSTNNQKHPYMKRLREIDPSQIPLESRFNSTGSSDDAGNFQCSLNYNTEYRGKIGSHPIRQIERLNVAFEPTMQYSAFCKENTGSNIKSPESLMYMADFLKPFDVSNEFTIENSRYFIAKTNDEKRPEENLAVLYGTFNPCKKTGLTPNTIVQNIKPRWDEFHVYKDLSLEMGFFQKPGFIPNYKSNEMKKLYKNLPYFQGLLFFKP